MAAMDVVGVSTSVLKPAQQRRLEACTQAARILRSYTAHSSPLTPDPIIVLANFILYGIPPEK